MYIKFNKLLCIETHKNLIPTKLNNHTAQCICCYITVITNIPYNWPAGSKLNSGYMSKCINQNTLPRVTAMHTILFKILNSFFLQYLSSITYILLLLTQSHLSIAQASCSFKCSLNMCTFMHTTPTFITEVLHLVTQLQLLLMTVTVN